MKFFQIIAGGCLALALLPSAQAVEDQSGVVLSFDDTFVNQWHDYFLRGAVSDVKATFFVSHWHTLSAAEIDKLKDLETAGHEIGNHTYSHKGVAGDFNFDPGRIDEYLNDQIIPSLQNMQADGFNPVSFSYPSGERNEIYDAAVRQYFPYLRTTFADENLELFQLDDIFHSANKNYGVLAGDGIDNSYGNPLSEIEGAFLRAKTNNEIITLYAHRILPDDSPDVNHRFGISYSKLDGVIAKAREMGLKFYTFSEAYEVGNQQPPSGGGDNGADNIQVALEGNRVRLQWTALANDFIGIVPVGQSEWVEGMPGAVTNGSTSGKIGITVNATAADQQYVAIFYNNFTEVGRSPSFTIAGDGSTGGGDNSGGGDDSNPDTGGGDSGNGNNGGTGGDNITIALEGSRVRLAWSALANDFIGIVPADQSEWVEGMAGASTGGGQQGKIGITVQADTVDQQYIAIFYSNGVKVGTSSMITVPGTGGSSGSDGGGNDAGGNDAGGNDAGGSDSGGGDSNGGEGNNSDSGAASIVAYVEGNRARLVWENLSTDFIGIVPVEQAEWVNGMAGAVTDGSSSQGKIGITVSDSIAGQQYKALFYRGTIQVGSSTAFVIN